MHIRPGGSYKYERGGALNLVLAAISYLAQ